MKNEFCMTLNVSINHRLNATTNKDVRVFIRRRSLIIKSSKGRQRYRAGTATSVNPRGAMPRPIPLVGRSRTDRRVCMRR